MCNEKDIEDRIEQMQRILNNMVNKIKVVVSLPFLLKSNKLKNLLKPNDMQLLREVRYYYKCVSTNAKGLEFIQGYENMEMLDKLSYLLEVFEQNTEINKLIIEHLSSVNPPDEILTAVELYKDFVKEQMMMTPKMKLERDAKIQTSLKNKQSLELEMNSLQEQLEELKKQLNYYLKKMTDEIALFESNIKKKQAEHEEELEKIVHSSEEEMIKTSQRMEKAKLELEKEIEFENNTYKKLVEENKIKESILQQELFEAEQENLSMIAVFDKEIGEKHRIKENLENELEQILQKYRKLKIDFEIQEKQYLELKEEKELINLTIFTEKLESLKKNRASRIIQRTWKTYRERMALKKKRKIKRK